MAETPQPERQPFEHNWSRWLDGQLWKGKLDKKLAHKALDIPEDDVIISNKQSGMSWKELLVIAAAALGGFHLWSQMPGTPPETPPPVASTPSDPDTDTSLVDIGKR